MKTVVLGLASGLSWGVADFCGGLAARRTRLATAVAATQVAGLATALVVLALWRPGAPAGAGLGLGLLAGIAGAGALFAFYRALAVGTMSLVAPISTLGALIPLAIDLGAGRSPGALSLAGMSLALAGAALAAAAPGPARRTGLGLAILAGAGFGVFFVLAAEAADEVGPAWTLLAVKLGSAPPAVAVALALGAAAGLARGGRGLLGLVVAAGAIESLANLAFAEATREGLTSVAAVLASLYPLATMALAALVLRERLGRLQGLGAGLALAGVAMIAAG